MWCVSSVCRAWPSSQAPQDQRESIATTLPSLIIKDSYSNHWCVRYRLYFLGTTCCFDFLPLLRLSSAVGLLLYLPSWVICCRYRRGSTFLYVYCWGTPFLYTFCFSSLFGASSLSFFKAFLRLSPSACSWLCGVLLISTSLQSAGSVDFLVLPASLFEAFLWLSPSACTWLCGVLAVGTSLQSAGSVDFLVLPASIFNHFDEVFSRWMWKTKTDDH